MLLTRTKNILRAISVLCLSVAFMATYANDTTQRAALRSQSVNDIRLLQQPGFDNDGGVQYLQFMRSKNHIVADHLGALALENQGKSDMHFIENILQNSPVSLFNSALITQNPNVYRALNDTLAFYQRRLTNLLLLTLLSAYAKPQQVDFHKPYFYLTNEHDGKVNLFDFIHAYHGEKFIDECFVPLVENSPLKLTAKGQRVFLSAIGDYYVGAPDPKHCHQRAVHWQKKWDALRYLPVSDIQKRLGILIAVHRLNHSEGGRNAYYLNNKPGERVDAGEQGVRLTTLVHDMQQAINHDKAAKVAEARFVLHPSADNAENFLKKENEITSHSPTINKKHKAQLTGIKTPAYSAGSEGINIYYDDLKPV